MCHWTTSLAINHLNIHTHTEKVEKTVILVLGVLITPDSFGIQIKPRDPGSLINHKSHSVVERAELVELIPAEMEIKTFAVK